MPQRYNCPYPKLYRDLAYRMNIDYNKNKTLVFLSQAKEADDKKYSHMPPWKAELFKRKDALAR